MKTVIPTTIIVAVTVLILSFVFYDVSSKTSFNKELMNRDGFVIGGMGDGESIFIPIKTTESSDPAVFTEFNFDEDSNILSFGMSSNNEGMLTILLPTELSLLYLGSDVIFDPIVLVNGVEVELKKENVNEGIELEFDYDSSTKKIEILLAMFKIKN